MHLTSYAQNFEDLMLWRALGHIENGRYIDIGAQDPSIDSVSRCFYEQGWRGVHVEPSTAYAAKLRDARPDETVIEALVATENGVAPFFEIASTGLSTGRADVADYQKDHGFDPRERHVAAITLASVFECLAGSEIHWLKIDVEGMEASVLKGWDEHPARPWILVIESTYPGTTRPTHEEWVQLVTDKGYREVWFDGLSRFYLHKDKEDLAPAFDRPPNIFDGFAISIDHLMSSYIKRNVEETENNHSIALDRLQRDLDGAVAQAKEQFDRSVSELSALKERHRSEMIELSGQVIKLQESLSSKSSEIRTMDDNWRRTLEDLRASKDEEIANVQARESGKLQAQASEFALERQAIEKARRQELRRTLLEQQRRYGRQLDALKEASGLMRQEFSEARREFGRVMTEADARERQSRAANDLLKSENENLLSRLSEAHSSLEVERGNAGKWQAQAIEAQQRLEAESLRSAGLLATETARTGKFRDGLNLLRAAITDFLTGLSHPMALLQAEDISRSTRLSVDDLAETRMRMMSEEDVNSVYDLLRIHDLDFVRATYEHLLGRQPEPAGEAHHLTRLRSGTSKIEILRDVMRSPEGSAYGSTLPGLDCLMPSRRFARIASLGRPGTNQSMLVNRSENEIGRLASALGAAYSESLILNSSVELSSLQNGAKLASE